MHAHDITITTSTGYTYPLTVSAGRCGELSPMWLSRGVPKHCERAADAFTADELPAGRRSPRICYCDEHGGPQRARAELARAWEVAAPPSVGPMHRVLEVGSQALTTREAYVVLRHEHGRWLAWIGLGSYLLAVDSGTPRLNRDGRPRMRFARGVLVPRTRKAFRSADDARSAAVAVWRLNLAGAVARITAARGGTLAWGVPIEPLSEPIVIDLGSRTGVSAWDVAVALPRATRSGAAWISGMRPSGEVA